MEFTTLGIIAMTISLSVDLPQFIRTLRTKDVESFSATWLISKIVLALSWLAYSLQENIAVMIITNLVYLMETIYLYALYIKYKIKE